MSDGMDFDEAMLETIQRLYRTESMAGRRAFIRSALDPDEGEEILSIGTGPGYEASELAPAVGAAGRVHGIDAAAPMLAAARDRCDAYPWVTFERGDATALPVADGSFDAALAVQVYEYVADLDAAFEELARVLRPGGRAIVFDSDWTTMTYNVADEDRSERLLRAFDAHCPHPRIARTLKPRIEAAGLDVTTQDAWVHLETTLDEDSLGGAFLPGIRDFATSVGDVDADVADAWVEDVRARAEADAFFFSFNQYLFAAAKPP